MSDDALSGYERSTFQHDGMTHDVYRGRPSGGAGPAVIVMHEIPGLHQGVIRFAQRLLDAGYSVYMPLLFGQAGEPYSPAKTMPVLLRACVSREFTVFADRTSRINSWLLALAHKAHAESGGPGVGAIGMCFTGNFALAMAIDDTVLAPVMSQPVLPLGRARIAVGPTDLARIKDRTADGLCVMGMRFTKDRAVPAQRFARLREELGDAFLAVEIDSSPGNPHGIKQSAHSVVTEDLVDEPGHPTRVALDQVMAFLAERLKG